MEIDRAQNAAVTTQLADFSIEPPHHDSQSLGCGLHSGRLDFCSFSKRSNRSHSAHTARCSSTRCPLTCSGLRCGAAFWITLVVTETSGLLRLHPHRLTAQTSRARWLRGTACL